jgi:magnesium transporter
VLNHSAKAEIFKPPWRYRGSNRGRGASGGVLLRRAERKLAAKDLTELSSKEVDLACAVPADESKPLGPRAVCVSLPVTGKPVRVLGNAVSEFISTLHDSTLAWINVMVDDVEKDGSDIATRLGFSASIVPEVLKGHYAAFEDRETEMAIMVPVVKIAGLDLETFPLLILVRKDLIVTVHSCEVQRLVLFSRYADTYMRKLPPTMPQPDKLTLMLGRILDENNSYNFEHLREIEEQADTMSEMLLDPSTPRLEIGRKIYDMKHTLITYLNTLWRTLDVLHSLRYGEAELVSDNPKTLAQIGLLVEDVNRQISLSEHMSEVLASGLEVLQALYNNQLQILNNRMALTMTWLTILGTAVLVPNTLATIFGFVFNVGTKELVWSLAVMTFATVGATYLAYWWVRRWVQLPKSPS